MIVIRALLLVCLAGCAGSQPALQPAAPAPVELAGEEEEALEDVETSSVAEDEPEYKDTTYVDFDGELTSTGTVAQPAAVITARRRPGFKAMVRRPALWTSTATR